MSTNSSASTDRDTEGLSLLHDEVDQLRSLLEAAWLLSVNDVKKPLSTLKSLQDDPKAVEQLFVQFTRTAGRYSTWGVLVGAITNSPVPLRRWSSFLCSSHAIQEGAWGVLVGAITNSPEPLHSVCTKECKCSSIKA